MSYLWFKTVHLVGVVSWMAGLFFVGRLFVNHVEALARPEPARSVLHEQLAGMTRRCYYGILGPALVVTVGCAVGMLVLQPALLGAGWLQAKLALVVLLVAYHLWCGRLMRALARGESPYGSTGYRLLNEVPTVFLLAVTLLAVFKGAATPRTMAQGMAGLLVLLVVGFVAYRRRRARAAGAVVAPAPTALAAPGAALSGGVGRM